MATTGPIPNTSVIKLETQKEIWQNIRIESSSKFLITGIIEYDGKKRKIVIHCQHILSPEVYRTKAGWENPNKSPFTNGLSKIYTFLFDYQSQYQWTILGVIEGSIQKPIILVYYENMDVYFYTIDISNKERRDLNIELNPN